MALVGLELEGSVFFRMEGGGRDEAEGLEREGQTGGVIGEKGKAG